jgi:malate synthase
MTNTPRTDEREARSEGLHDKWAFSFCRQLERELNETTERLGHAEIVLSDLAYSYWRAVLDDQDPSGGGIGEGVNQYWARYSDKTTTTKP